MTKKQLTDMYGEVLAEKTIRSLEDRGAYVDDPNVPGEKMYLVRKDLSESGSQVNDRSLATHV